MNDYPLKQTVAVSLDAPMGQMFSHEVTPFAAGALDAANAGRARAMGQLEADYIKMSDYKAGAQGERDLDGLRDEYEQRIQRGLDAAPGSAESLFLEDGTQDTDKIAALQSEMQEAFTAVEPRFLSPEAEVRWQENKAGYLQNVENRIKGQVAQHELRSIRQAFEERHALALAQGDTGAALRNIDNAVDAGIITNTKANSLKQAVEKKAVENRIAGLMENDPGAAFDYLNGEASRYLTPIERLRYADALRARAKQSEAQKLDGFFSGGIPASVKAEFKAEGKEKKDGPEYWGTHSQKEIAWLYAVKNGQAAEVLPAVRGHAVTEAMSLSPQLLDDPAATEQARAEFEARYLYYGMEKSDINRIWNDGMKNLARVRVGGINPKVRLDAAKGGGQLFNREAFDAWRNSWKKDEDGELTYEEFEKDGYARIRWGAAAGVSDKDDKEQAYAKIEKLKQVNMQAEMEGRIQERYSAWLDTKEGEAATPLEQLEKLNAIASAEVGHKVSVGGAGDIQDLRTQALDMQGTANQEFQRNNKREYREERPEQTATWQKVDVGFDTEQKDLPRGILVPEAMLQGKKKEDVVYDMIFDNEHFLRLPVVGTTKGGAPVMTYATAREGGRMPNKVYTVQGKLRSGNASVLLDEVENPVGNVKYANGNYATGDWAGTLNTQHVPQGLQPYINDFVEAGEQYGVNPAFLIAISMNETADGTSSAFRNKNNAMGISNESGPIRMLSVRSSIFKMAKELGTRAHYKGKTLKEIGSVYAPVGAKNDPRGLNGGWANGVAAKLKKLNS